MKKLLKYFIAVITVMMMSDVLKAQCSTSPCTSTGCCRVNAGTDKTSTCPGNCISIGVAGCVDNACNSCANCSSYIYSWSPGGGTSCQVTVCPTVTTTYTLYVSCSVPGNACCDAVSDVMTVTVNSSGCRLANPGAQAEVTSDAVNLFPNPNNGTFKLQFAEAIKDNTVIQVFDIIGEYIGPQVTIVDKEVTINVTDKAKGTYFVLVKYAESIMLLKKVIYQ